ncbi:RING finger protein unkempt isoform X2 [Culicoides brevitarsis]|uniref:RING finger protein unkempt isoform X2 n=1 Tax=Culicoides brevitarsis TaxID=469753 RepID=UPI00307B5F83
MLVESMEIMANSVLKTDTNSLIVGDHDISALLTPQTEKPNHYTYLKEFRVEQCPAFLQHKCNQHRPFVCFHWHFQNQRRRRPVRRDGTFNYSADVYCQNYDETTGLCTNGDDCPFLHRTAGDTERRYHLRYYKTCMCVHDTDSRGNCVKNGQHCAFAHGIHDQRPPVYDIKELEAMQNAENAADAANGPNVLDKERSLMNEDPKWQDTNYVLANYKTEPCKRPPRLCRQGYACPQYHNSKDKRRSPRKFKYRSTPCPNVKHGEEWGEPANCDAGDNCQYCHTRTEQQFHPEIYKSTKCNDVQQAGYCPRSVFCAFAHVEPYVLTEELAQRDMEGPPNPLALSEIISNALPPDLSCSLKKELKPNDFMNLNGNAESSESASTSSIGSNHSSHNKAPGAQLHHHKIGSLSQQFQNNHLTNHTNSNLINNMYSNNTSFNDFTKADVTKQLILIDNDPSLTPLEKEQRKRMCLNFNLGYTGGVHNSLDEFGRRDSAQFGIDNSMSAGILQNSSAPINVPGSPMGLLQGQTAPVNIPGSQLNSFSPSKHANLFGVTDPFGNPGSFGGGSAPKISNSYGQTSDNLLFQSHLISPHGFDGLSMSPDLGRISELNAINSELSNAAPGQNSLFDNHLQSSAPGSKPHHGSYSMSPLVTGGLSEITRLREELQTKNVQLSKMEEQTAVWQKEVEDRNHKIQLAEQQRDEALSQIKQLKEKVEQLNISAANFRTNELRGMPLHKLKTLQAKLRSELEEVDNVLYVETASKCMICEENPRSVTLVPCNHYALCDTCAVTQRECPYCQTPVTSQA